MMGNRKIAVLIGIVATLLFGAWTHGRQAQPAGNTVITTLQGAQPAGNIVVTTLQGSQPAGNIAVTTAQ